MSAIMDKQQPQWVVQIEKLINKALSLDEETLYALGQLSGKVIAFEFINTKFTLYIFPEESGLQIHTVFENKSDVLIKGTPGNFIMMMAASRQDKGGLPTDMQIIGDVGLAQRFQAIMQNIEIDMEEPMSKWLGDTISYQLGKFVRGSSRFAFKTGKTLAMDLSEFLRFETEMLPDDLLVEEFCKDVDLLREDVDRLVQRINKLDAKINKNGNKE